MGGIGTIARRLMPLALTVGFLMASPGAMADESDSSAAGPFGPFAGYTLDPLGPSQPDDVPAYRQPDWSQDPLFNTYFGSGICS